MKRSVLFALIGLALLCSALGADEPKKSGTPPQLFNYQGRLVDENGVPVPDGTYTVYFRIYDVVSEGEWVWQEKLDVPVFKGLYSVLLHLSDQIDWTTDKFFAVRVEGQSEMVPRQQMASVPWAFQSETAAQAGHAVLADTATQADQAEEAAHAATATEASLAHDVDDASVTTPKIADDAVAGPKLAPQFGQSQRELLNFVPRLDSGTWDGGWAQVPFNYPNWTDVDLTQSGIPATARAVLLSVHYRDDGVASYLMFAPEAIDQGNVRQKVYLRCMQGTTRQHAQVIVKCRDGHIAYSLMNDGGDNNFLEFNIAVQGWWEPAKTD